MKKLTTLLTMAAIAFSIAVVDADDKKKRDPKAERNFKGKVLCAKCLLKKTDSCQVALEVTRKNKDGKETTRVLLLKDNEATKEALAECKKEKVEAVVTGKLEGKGKKRVLVASKIQLKK